MKKVVLLLALVAFVLGGTVNAQETKPAKGHHKEAHVHHNAKKVEKSATDGKSEMKK